MLLVKSSCPCNTILLDGDLGVILRVEAKLEGEVDRTLPSRQERRIPPLS